MTKGKRGSIEAYQIILTVIMIMSLVVGLMVWYYLKPNAESNDQICSFSVLLRATSPEAAQNFIPLKCTTNKICITQNASRCDFAFAGEKELTVVKLQGDGPLTDDEIDKAARIVEFTSAQAMYNCWDSMYQGKFDLFNNWKRSRALTVLGGSEYKSYCRICARVAVDYSVNDSILKKVNVPRYIQNNNPPGQDKSYLQLFTDNEYSSYPIASRNPYDEVLKEISDPDGKITDIEKGRQAAYVFMQVTGVTAGEAFKKLGSDATSAGGAGLLVAGGVFATSPTVAFQGVISFAGRAIKAVPYAVALATIGSSNVVINSLVSQQVAAGYCGPLTSQNGNGDGTTGCSIVEAVPYSANAINNICGVPPEGGI